MKRTKIDYGIDLGTTNSSIVRMQGGELTIFKSDYKMDTTPSCIGINKKGSHYAGSSALLQLNKDKLNAMRDFKSESSNIFIEFKRTMGTDKSYFSPYVKRAFTSEELSAEILMKLKSFVDDEGIKSVVITVPAKFTINQKDATVRAAKLAGFEQCELLQEPIAASMAYGLRSLNKDGIWLVFDFGGGTFDAALVRVEDGIMKVVDTDGDNYLGGKNIDYAIVDEIIIPYFKQNFKIHSIIEDQLKLEIFRDAMKQYAEEAKIQMSYCDTYNILSDIGDIPGEDDLGDIFELDLTLTQSDLEKVVFPIFQKAVEICKDLLKRNNLNGAQIDKLILVGGPTYSPILRKMLREQITEKVDTSCDPMTVVAKGAALYASTIDISENIIDENRDKGKIQLSLNYESTTVEPVEFVTVKILKDKSERLIPNKCFIEISRADKAWASGKLEIDEIGEVFEVLLSNDKTNAFNISLFDELGNLIPSEPGEFTIIQGSKVGSATLPYHIGVEILSGASGKLVFKPIKGLEKNQSLPAKGVINGLKTQKQINPGVKSDTIRIPIYQGSYGAEGSRAIYNEHVYDVIITGEEIPSVLPEDSDVDFTVSVDRSEGMTLSVYFPFLNLTQEVEIPRDTTQKEIDSEWLETEIARAKQTLLFIKQEDRFRDKHALDKLTQELSESEKLLEQGRSDYDRKKQILNSLRLSLKKLDEIQDSTEWPKTEEELKDSYDHLEDTFNDFGGQIEGLNGEKIKEALTQFREQIPQVIKEKNVKVAKELIDLMRGLAFNLADQALGARMEIGILRQFNENFNTHEWSDERKARSLINQGLQIASNNPSKQRLRPIVMELFKLLPGVELPNGFGGGGHLKQ